ncbi:MAG: tRNA pseudouridine(13) synthase TruD [Thermoanaerobaculia bacterium]|nr:tRNA pseudouridine(13) synthase TruD [Thermoanaerobaculia bacterium]
MSPEDFRVEELPLYEPSGEGHHTWLWVEKRLRTTRDVVDLLARRGEVAPRRVGYAGRKDRRALSRQWISVPGLDPDRALETEDDGIRVLRAVPHRHRLHVGDLRGNRFRILVRDVSDPEGAGLEDRWVDLRCRGLPNRFGSQRFGRDGLNPERGRRILAGEPVPGSRRVHRLFVSALQSAVFNEALLLRPVPVDELLVGDLLLDHASGALRPVRDPGDWADELEAFRVSPTGPLFGPKMRMPTGRVAGLEEEARRRHRVPEPLPEQLLRRYRLSGERRPLRVPVDEARMEARDGAVFLVFSLPPGSYATVLLEELFPEGIREVRGS